MVAPRPSAAPSLGLGYQRAGVADPIFNPEMQAWLAAALSEKAGRPVTVDSSLGLSYAPQQQQGLGLTPAPMRVAEMMLKAMALPPAKPKRAYAGAMPPLEKPKNPILEYIPPSKPKQAYAGAMPPLEKPAGATGSQAVAGSRGLGLAPAGLPSTGTPELPNFQRDTSVRADPLTDLLGSMTTRGRDSAGQVRLNIRGTVGPAHDLGTLMWQASDEQLNALAQNESTAAVAKNEQLWRQWFTARLRTMSVEELQQLRQRSLVGEGGVPNASRDYTMEFKQYWRGGPQAGALIEAEIARRQGMV